MVIAREIDIRANRRYIHEDIYSIIIIKGARYDKNFIFETIFLEDENESVENDMLVFVKKYSMFLYL